MELKDFSHGYRTNNVTVQSIQKGYNVELINTSDGKGAYKCLGNASIAQITGEKIVGGFDYVKGDNHYHLIFTNDTTESKVYLLVNGTETLLKDSLSSSAKHFNAVNFNNGAFISNGYDDPIFYEYGVIPAVQATNAVAYDSTPCIGLPLKVFDNRIFMGVGSGLYSCGLGDCFDWASADVETTRAGYINNFKNSSATVTALETYKSALMIHRGDTDITSLSGTSETYTMSTVSNVGCNNHACIANLDIYQLYFIHNNNGIGLYYLSSNELGTIKAESEISTFIHEEFTNIDTARLDEIYVLPRTDKNQVWIHVPRTDYPSNSVWYIYDLSAKCFYPPRIQQPITSAWLFEGDIYTGTADGKILKEDFGKTFDGTAINAKARFQTQDFGTLFKKESEDKFRIKFDSHRVTNCLLSIIKNDDDRTIRSQTIISNPTGCMIWGTGLWGEDWASFYPMIIKKGKPPKCMQYAVEISTEGGDFGLQILELPQMNIS